MLSITSQAQDKTLYNYLKKGVQIASTPQASPATLDTRIVYQYSGGFANLTDFNRNKSDTAYNMYFQQASNDLYQASNQQYYIAYEALRARIGEDEETRNIVNVGLINAAYDIMNYDESNPDNPENGWRLEGDALVPIAGRQQFFNVYTTLLSVLKNRVEGNSITFKFRNDLFFTNNGAKDISNITADLGDGVLHTIYSNGLWTTTSVNINFIQTKSYIQQYNITYNTGETLTTYSILEVLTSTYALRAMTASLGGDIANRSVTSDYAFKGYEPDDVAIKGVLDYRIFYRNGHNGKLMRPIIILDGVDFGDQRKIEKSDYLKPEDPNNLTSLYDMMEYTLNNIQKNYVEDLKDKGYDVILVNFPSDRIKNPIFAQLPPMYYNMLPLQYRFIDGGADYIERNALTFATMLKRIDQELRNNGSNQKTIVFGPSMGGQVSRYALAWMEKNNIPHNVSLWVSMDSPHHGANIPIGLQSALYLAKEAGKAEDGDFYNFSLKSPAAQQMLINQHKDSTDIKFIGGFPYLTHFAANSYLNARVKEQGFSEDRGAPYYQRFYKENYSNGLPGSKGFPVNLKKVTMINGYQGANTYGSYGEQTFNARGFGYICFLKCFPVHVMSFETYNLGQYEAPTRVARFKRGFNDKEVYAVNRDNRGNLDILPGSSFAVYDLVAAALTGRSGAKKKWEIFIPDNILFWSYRTYKSLTNPNIEIRNNKQAAPFMASISTLGYKNPDRNWNVTLDNKEAIKNEIYFDDFYAPNTIQEHVQITPENVAWLNTWLDNVKNDTLDCSNKKVNISIQEVGCNEIKITITGALPGTIHSLSSTANNIIFENGTTSYSTTSTIVYATLSTVPENIYIKLATKNACGQSLNIERGYHFNHERVITGVFSEYPGGDHVSASVNTNIYDTYYRWYMNGELVSEGADATQYCTCDGYKDFRVSGNNILRVEVETTCGEFSSAEHYFYMSGGGYYRISPNPSSSVINISPENTNLNMRSNTINKSETSTSVFDQITISDISGNIKLRQNTRKTNTLQLNVNSLSNGIYYLNLYNGGKLIEKKTIQISK